MSKKVVLAYSGGLDTTYCAKYLSDDLGYETLGCYGGTSYKTPILDNLANSGALFNNAHVQPLCTPTRVQLMSGKYNFRNYIGFGLMDPNERTFGHI